MYRSKHLFMLFFAFALTVTAFTQNHFTKYDKLPGIIKSYKPQFETGFPAWAKMLYAENINFKTIGALFQKEEGSGMEEEEGNETAIKRYYIIWRKAVLPFVKKNGNIEVPDNIEQIMENRTGYVPVSTAKVFGISSWTFAGPKETWWENDGSTNDHNECPWQVNIYSFDVSLSNSNILFAGTETGFVNKSIDKGLHWNLVGSNYRFGGAITAIAIHPTNPKIAYVSAGNQIHKTTDGGVSWSKMLLAGNTFAADRLRIDTTNPNKIYASSNDGLFVSTNSGIGWAKKITLPCFDAEIKTDNSSVVYAIVQEKNGSGKKIYAIYLSLDGGLNFNKDNNFNFGDLYTSGGLLAVSAASPQSIFAAVLTDNDTPKIYKGIYNNSTHQIAWALITTGNSNSLTAKNWQGYYDLVFDVSPTDANTIYFGTSGLYKSTNGGATFKAIYDYGAANIIQIHPDAQDFKLINGQEGWVSTDGGLTFSTDAFATATNAMARNNGIVGSDFWGFDQGWNEDLMVGGRYHNGNTAIGEFYGDKALSLGGAESPTGWIMPGQSRHAAFDDLGGGHILPSSLTGKEEGTFPFTKFPSMYYYGYRRGGFVVHPNYYNIFFLCNGNGIWKSVNGGASFDLLHDFGTEVWQIQISRTNPKVMYADTKDGLYRTEDGGNIWLPKSSLTSDPYGYDWWKGNMSIVISPYNENVLYVCPQDNWPDNVRKIFRSADGGNTWADWTTPVLHDYGTKWLAIQPMPGNKDGIYLFTNYSWDGTIGGKVFFRSEDMSDWADYSNNYPVEASINFAAAMPFYRDSKLRAAGNMGIWETPLYEKKFTPTAINPMVDKSGAYGCARDTFYFDDYSIVNHKGAVWAWSFNPAPTYISDIHARNPKVVFANGGKYAVTEAITQNGITYSRTIKDMVDISTNVCGTIDTVPGKAATFSGNEYVKIPSFNLPATNHFTFSNWIKPDASQKDWAGLIMPIGNGFSLNLLPSMELRYGNYYWISANAFVTPGQWNHVMLVVEPTKATIYVNGKAFVVKGTNDPQPIDKGIWLGTQEGWGTERAYTGLMDELCFWNRSLTQNEVREQMHLVKNPAIDNTLLHYYQFNETSGTIAFDKVALTHISLGAVTYSTSTAPVGAGVSKRLNVNASGVYTFGNTGLKINFAAGTQPNGELCVTLINQNSQNSSSTNSNLLFGRYWIINNYGTNQTFTSLASLEADNCGPVSSAEIATPAQIKLFKRGSFNEASVNWQQVATASNVAAAGGSSNIIFTSPTVTSFSQFELQRTNEVLATQSISLNVEMLSLKNISVTWETFGEENIDHFAIERSVDGVHFLTLAQQNAMNTPGNHTYNYSDINPLNGVLYYRIAILNKNKPTTYSPIKNITVSQQFSLFEVFPNPLQKGQLLKTNVTSSEPYQLHIYNAKGEEVYNAKHAGNAQIKVMQLAAGMYFYTAVWSKILVNGKLVIE